jgi:hypothetical protein
MSSDALDLYRDFDLTTLAAIAFPRRLTCQLPHRLESFGIDSGHDPQKSGFLIGALDSHCDSYSSNLEVTVSSKRRLIRGWGEPEARLENVCRRKSSAIYR